MAFRSFIALTVTAAAIIAGCSGSDSGLAARTLPALYEIQVVSPATPGLQVNRTFSVTLNFVEPGTAAPYDQPATESITASVLAGAGNLGGTISRTGNGTSSLVFDDLFIDATGPHVIEFRGPRAGGTGKTAILTIERRMKLHFAVVPSSALKGRPFSATIQTVDPVTMAIVAPLTPVPVQLECAPGTGSSTLSGAAGVTVVSGVTTVSTLTYPVAEMIALKASAPGLGEVTSAAFVVDALQVSFSATPDGVLVNGTFSLTIEITGQISGLPCFPQPSLSASVAVATGTGALSGGTSAQSNGSTIVFSNLRYNQIGNATFVVNSLETPTALSSPITFGLCLGVSATGPSSTPPSGLFNPYLFRAIDGIGVVWAGPMGLLSWSLTDSQGVVVQTASASFAAGIASVTPLPVALTGNYLLTGTVTSPGSASSTIGVSVNNLVLVNQPGPFVALKTCRVGTPYNDSVSSAAPPNALAFGQLSGTLPPGLALNGATGAIFGVPTLPGSYAFNLYASLPAGDAQPIRCALAVFSLTEGEIVPGQNFGLAGPHAVHGPIRENFTFVSSYDSLAYPSSATANPPWAPCQVEYFYPSFVTASSPAPVFIHHRGRGFSMADYRVLGSHLASHGFIFVSVEDYQSFADNGAAAQADAMGNNTYTANPNQVYDISAPERGMLSASAFQEAAMRWLESCSAQSGHTLYKRVDADRVFAGGHSRGGGATHGSHVRSKPYTFASSPREGINLRGVVYFMAFDLRYFNSTIAGSPVVYPVPTTQSRLPSLVMAAERDGDLFYPICDQFIDRASGPTTFATIYGGCHAFLSDNGAFDAHQATITRQQQQRRMFNLVVAFLKRWSNLDLSLDGMLYNNELAGSGELGVCAWRNMMEATVVDNHQGANAAFNLLGGSNTMTGGSFSTAASAYPALGHYSTLDLRHNILTLTPGATGNYATYIPTQHQNQSKTRRIVFRCGSIDATGEPLKGFDWTTIRLRATSGANTTATITLFDRLVGASGDLPDYVVGNSVYDRFVDVSVRWNRFTQANPAFSKSQVTKLELVFETDGTSASRQFYFDDLRFE